MLDRIVSIVAKQLIRLVDFLTAHHPKLDEKKRKRLGIERAKNFAKTVGELRLDLGCGSFKRPGFVGVDLSPHADIQWDIQLGLPFEDNSITEIRSDHFFEHLELPCVVEILRQCHRVLVPDGVLDFTVPHLDPYLEAYLNKDLEFFKEKIFDIPKGQEGLYETCFDRLAWLLCRSGEHKSLFDKESILQKVKLAGFTNVTTRKFDERRDTNFRYSSIYVVAMK